LQGGVGRFGCRFFFHRSVTRDSALTLMNYVRLGPMHERHGPEAESSQRFYSAFSYMKRRDQGSVVALRPALRHTT
jgi:hypothetical protein